MCIQFSEACCVIRPPSKERQHVAVDVHLHAPCAEAWDHIKCDRMLSLHKM